MSSIDILEKIQMESSLKLVTNQEYPEFDQMEAFLYHCIKPPKQLEKLENIFKCGKILADKYLTKTNAYSNSTNHEFIALLHPKTNSPDNARLMETYIEPNITLVVSPSVDADKAICIPITDLMDIQTNYNNLKNRYSCINEEYQVKDHIDMDYVLAIGLPYNYLINQNKNLEAATLLRNVNKLMNKYNIDKPIIDTSDHNKLLMNPTCHYSFTYKKLYNKKVTQ